MKELVVDVSHCDPNFDASEWVSKRGLWGVIIKLGGYENLGKGYPEEYKHNWTDRHYASAKAAGVHVGFYYYSVATTVSEARSNAEHCASLLSAYDYDMPVYMDVEDSGQLEIGSRALTDVILAFINRLRELGHNAGLYTYRSMLHSSMYGDELEPYPLWIAEYASACHTNYSHGMWQFGAMNVNTGDVTWGDASGYTDANWCYVNYAAGGSSTSVEQSPSDAENDRGLRYRVHVQNCGDLPDVHDGMVAGTTGRSLRMEALEILGVPSGSDIKAEVHIQGRGWVTHQSALKAGWMGTTGQSKRLEAVKLTLTKPIPGCKLMLQGHVEGYGWQDPVGEGELCGTTGQSRRLEAIKIWLAPKQEPGTALNDAGLKYQAHVQDLGDCAEVRDGQQAGTQGFSKRLEAFRINALPSGWRLRARLHIQNVGWVTQDVKVGEWLGTKGKSQAIECVMFEVLEKPKGDNRNLWFRVHQQDAGTKAWTPAPFASGTDGMSKRLESIALAIR